MSTGKLFYSGGCDPEAGYNGANMFTEADFTLSLTSPSAKGDLAAGHQ